MTTRERTELDARFTRSRAAKSCKWLTGYASGGKKDGMIAEHHLLKLRHNALINVPSRARYPTLSPLSEHFCGVVKLNSVIDLTCLFSNSDQSR